MGRKGYSDDMLHSSPHFPSTQVRHVPNSKGMLAQLLNCEGTKGEGRSLRLMSDDRDGIKLHDKFLVLWCKSNYGSISVAYEGRDNSGLVIKTNK